MFNTSSQPKYRPSMSFNEILVLKQACKKEANRSTSFYKNYNGNASQKKNKEIK
jgi:hypothetical protein